MDILWTNSGMCIPLPTQNGQEMVRLPRKTIYIRDEDLAIFDRAKEELDLPVGTIVINALQDALREKEGLWHESFCLQMIRIMDLPILNELIDFRLRSLPADIALETDRLALLAFRTSPDLYNEYASGYDPLFPILYGEGYDHEVFQLGLEAARKAERIIEETKKAWKVARLHETYDFYPPLGIIGCDELAELPDNVFFPLLRSGSSDLFELLLEESPFPESFQSKLESVVGTLEVHELDGLSDQFLVFLVFSGVLSKYLADRGPLPEGQLERLTSLLRSRLARDAE